MQDGSKSRHRVISGSKKKESGRMNCCKGASRRAQKKREGGRFGDVRGSEVKNRAGSQSASDR